MNKIAFTIVLNGMPFIKEQYKIIPGVFDHWYIVEGVSRNINCTRWCNPVTEKYHKNNLSNDGTTEFLDSITDDNITIIRKLNNDTWAGKVEMCNSFMGKISNSILMQIDVDEIWDVDVLYDIFSYCDHNYDRFDAMQFRCNFYMGRNLIVNGMDCYGDMDWDWWRLWSIKEPTAFVSHEPPKITNQKRVIKKDDTYKMKWIFDHFAYVYEHQVQFKEDFYGYKNAVTQWNKLNSLNEYSNIDASEYLSWINGKCPVKLI
tara:strand:+ start:536 stop:1315 length:780 start_codon:yes stop_codon:yes gene_type:complete